PEDRYICRDRDGKTSLHNPGAGFYNEIGRGRSCPRRPRQESAQVGWRRWPKGGGGMKVRDVYTRGAITVTPRTSIAEARRLMEQHKIRRLPVVDGDRLVGIVTQTDLLRATPSVATSLSVWEINYLLDKVRVEEIMTRNVVTVAPDTDLAEVAQLMIDRKVGGLPVVEDGRVVGVITESDVFRALVRLLAAGGEAAMAGADARARA